MSTIVLTGFTCTLIIERTGLQFICKYLSSFWFRSGRQWGLCFVWNKRRLQLKKLRYRYENCTILNFLKHVNAQTHRVRLRRRNLQKHAIYLRKYQLCSWLLTFHFRIHARGSRAFHLEIWLGRIILYPEAASRRKRPSRNLSK